MSKLIEHGWGGYTGKVDSAAIREAIKSTIAAFEAMPPPKDPNCRRFYFPEGGMIVVLFDGDKQMGAMNSQPFTKEELESMPIYEGPLL